MSSCAIDRRSFASTCPSSAPFVFRAFTDARCLLNGRETGNCVLSDMSARCAYFEKHLLPTLSLPGFPDSRKFVGMDARYWTLAGFEPAPRRGTKPNGRGRAERTRAPTAQGPRGGIVARYCHCGEALYGKFHFCNMPSSP